MMIDEILNRLMDLSDKYTEKGLSDRRDGIRDALSIVHEVFRANEKTKTDFYQLTDLPEEVPYDERFNRLDRLDRLVINLRGLKVFRNRMGTISYEYDDRVFEDRIEIARYIFDAHEEYRKGEFDSFRDMAIRDLQKVIKNTKYKERLHAKHINEKTQIEDAYTNEED